jgi:hypothetical protein
MNFVAGRLAKFSREAPHNRAVVAGFGLLLRRRVDALELVDAVKLLRFAEFHEPSRGTLDLRVADPLDERPHEFER